MESGGGQLVPRAEEPRTQVAPGWLARFAAATGSASGSMRAVLSALQEAITRAAAGAARTSTRLGSVSSQIQRSNATLGEMLDTAGRLNEDIRRIAASSNETRGTAEEMKRVSTEGRSLSRQGAASPSSCRRR